MNRTFTGRHMATILVAFFGVVIVVNVAMARLALSTFGGVVVENSYVASQEFNKWLNEASDERALGWQAQVSRRQDGRVAVELKGAPADATLSALARHPLGTYADRNLIFSRQANGSFASSEPLPMGRWQLRFEARAGGRHWRDEASLQ